MINDLFDYENLKIVQDNNSFKLSIDSVLLAEFVNINKKYFPGNILIVDFCTGNAPVPLILSTKSNAKIIGYEIQEKIYNLALESIKINNKEDQITIINKDVNLISEDISVETVDIVTCNPPYFKIDKDSVINSNKEKSIARHEILINIEDIAINASKILKNKGLFFMVHRPERLEEIISSLKKYNLIVKKLQFIYAKYDKNAIMVLIEAVKNGNAGLKVLKPLDLSVLNTYQDKVGE